MKKIYIIVIIILIITMLFAIGCFVYYITHKVKSKTIKRLTGGALINAMNNYKNAYKNKYVNKYMYGGADPSFNEKEINDYKRFVGENAFYYTTYCFYKNRNDLDNYIISDNDLEKIHNLASKSIIGTYRNMI